MLNIDNYRFKIGSQNFVLTDVFIREPPPRVPLASFGFQKPVAYSGGNSSRVALRDFVQETQPKFKIRIFAKIRSVAKRRDWSFRQNTPRVFEIQKEQAGREAGVRANLFEKISFGFEIFFGSNN